MQILGGIFLKIAIVGTLRHIGMATNISMVLKRTPIICFTAVSCPFMVHNFLSLMVVLLYHPLLPYSETNL